MLKIHTYNLEQRINTEGQVIIENSLYKDFSIIYTKNMSNVIFNIEHYEELDCYKSKCEKVSSYRKKIEELNEEKCDKIKNVKTNKGRKKLIINSFKSVIEKEQKKDQLDRQRKDTKNTLTAFLDNPSVKVY